MALGGRVAGARVTAQRNSEALGTSDSTNFLTTTSRSSRHRHSLLDSQNERFPIRFSAPNIREKAAIPLRRDSLQVMKDPAEIESVVVGIFDDSQQMEEADKRLAAAGFEGAVYGAAFRADESCEVNPVAVGTLLAPGFVPPDGSEDRESGLSRIDAFRSRLAECHLRDEVIDAYATAYSNQGRFLVVRTEPECVKYVVAILQECRASRVDQHDSDALV